MKRFAVIALVLLFSVYGVAQASSAEREAQRDQLRQLLSASVARTHIEFHQSEKNPWNFVGNLRDKITTCDYIEVIIGISDNNTIRVNAYPHLNGHYINLSDARNESALMRNLLSGNNKNFLYWSADDAGDLYQSFNFTLESGFPSEAIVIALRSVNSTDGFVAEMKGDLKPR